ALMRLGEYVAEHGIAGEGRYQAARDLLLRLAPRLTSGNLQLVGETTVQSAVRVAAMLRGSLPIQGPPGAGKTYTGAKMICSLAKEGKKVGITANSHKVIRNLLDATRDAAAQAGQTLRSIQKVAEPEDDLADLQFTTDNGELLESI